MSPAMWKAYKRTFSRMVDSVLSHTKNAHDGGEEKALWDAVLFCLQTNIPMPKPWPSGALEKFALDRIATTKKPGRPTKWLRDLLIFDSVNRWRQERIAFGQKGKS